VGEITSSSSSSSSSSLRRRHSADNECLRRYSPPTGNDVTGQAPRDRTMTSPSPAAAAGGGVDETAPAGGGAAAAGPPLVRRRAVDLSDLRSCALVQTQMKTRKASASWRYDNSV